jgi:BMFP domain-containing protein YqiC
MSAESDDKRIGQLEEQIKELVNVQKVSFESMEDLRKVTLELALMDTHLMEAINMLKTELVSRMRLLAEAHTVDPEQRAQLLDTVSRAETDFDTSVFVLAKTRERINKLLEPPQPPPDKPASLQSSPVAATKNNKRESGSRRRG